VSRLPIRLRLTLTFALVMGVVLAATGGFVYVRVGDALLASVDQTLHSQATEAATRAHDEHGLVDQDASGGTTLAQLLDADGAVTRTTIGAMAPLLSPGDAARVAAGGTVWRSITLKTPAGDWRVLGVRARDGGVVAVARSLEPREETLHRLLHELMIAFPLALLLAAVAGYALAAGALRPVEAMRRRAAAVTATRPGRLPVPRSRDEVSRLALTLNDMLERLEASFQHERRFLSDASHELRTPLALLRAELELALRRPRSAEELELALRSAAEETERLSRLAEDLLLIARADQGALPIRREHIPATDVLTTVAERFAMRARSHMQVVHVEGGDAMLDADPLRVEQALGNLVDNALAHGGGAVTLEARPRNGVVELHVTDDGPGFPEDFVERAFDRFSRADDARSRGGTGLGLSIVALIADAHGCDAGASNRPTGGADVWFAVPAPPRQGKEEAPAGGRVGGSMKHSHLSRRK
jgi:two-component system, OmpR family, sensor kinase